MKGLAEYLMSVNADTQHLQKIEAKYKQKMEQEEKATESKYKPIIEKLLNPIRLYNSIIDGLNQAYKAVLEKGGKLTAGELAGVARNLYNTADSGYKVLKVLESSKIKKSHLKKFKETIEAAMMEAYRIYRTSGVREIIDADYKQYGKFIQAARNFKG